MVLIVKLVAIAVIIYGCLIILRPDTLKQLVEKAKEGNNIYIWGGVKAFIGLLFVIASSNCSVPWVVRFIGALALLGGLSGFVLKKSFIINIMDWIENKPARFNYYIGIISLLIGVITALAA